MSYTENCQIYDLLYISRVIDAELVNKGYNYFKSLETLPNDLLKISVHTLSFNEGRSDGLHPCHCFMCPIIILQSLLIFLFGR